MKPSSVWKHSNSSASLNGNEFRATVLLNEPNNGLTQVWTNGIDFSGNKFLGFGLEDGQSIADCYVRGDDLVATYTESKERKCRPQVYWRYVNANSISLIDLLISMQTSFLESDPSLSTQTRLTDGTSYYRLHGDFVEAHHNVELKTPFVVHRWKMFKNVSYVEMVHPSDVDASTLEFKADSKSSQISHNLFLHALEKGVIRRGRLRAAFIHRINDFEVATKLFDQFISSPLPLTT